MCLYFMSIVLEGRVKCVNVGGVGKLLKKKSKDQKSLAHEEPFIFENAEFEGETTKKEDSEIFECMEP